MKRKLTALLLAVLTAAALAVPACADVIWEPEEDSFYKNHWDECTYVGRPYLLAGYDGAVTLYTAPGGMGKTTLDNGEQGSIRFTWEGDGIDWGYLTTGKQEGWVPMDDLTPVYDCQQFMSEHSAEIVTGEPVPVDFHEAVLYSYPNGTTSGYTLKEAADYQPFDQTFSQVYTDESGLRWGYVGYYMARHASWVCLDDPMNDSLTGGIVSPALSPAQQRGSATVGPGASGASALPVAAALVAAVVAVTGALVLKLKKRETK